MDVPAALRSRLYAPDPACLACPSLSYLEDLFLLRTRRKTDSEFLGRYFSLHKFCFYKRMLPEGEEVTRLGVETTARHAAVAR